MKYLFVLNPISGPKERAQKLIHKIDKVFKETDNYYEFVFTTKPGDATKIAQQGAAEGFDFIVAAGGDGTVNELASGLVNSPASMGIIPLGSGNGVARSLSIPIKVNKSIELLKNPQVEKIDIGQVNDSYFVGVTGLGYDALVGAKFQEFGVRGPIPYFIIGVRELMNYTAETIKVEINGKEISVSPLLIAFANTKQYGNGAIIAPEAIPNDGYLDICVINPVSTIQAFYLFYQMVRGSINKSQKYTHYLARSVIVKREHKKTMIHTDGEPRLLEGDLKITLLEKSLKVCVGPNFTN